MGGIRLRGDVPITTEGPLVEAEDRLAAYYILDCESHEWALSIAERTLDSHVTAVEVRQIHDSFGMERPRWVYSG